MFVADLPNESKRSVSSPQLPHRKVEELAHRGLGLSVGNGIVKQNCHHPSDSFYMFLPISSFILFLRMSDVQNKQRVDGPKSSIEEFVLVTCWTSINSCLRGRLDCRCSFEDSGGHDTGGLKGSKGSEDGNCTEGSNDSSAQVMPSFDPRYSKTSDVAREAVIPMSRVDEVGLGGGW